MGKNLGPGPDPDLDIVRTADASPSDLQRIAGIRPDLLPDIAAHPYAYPDLLAWLATHQDPAIQEALARRGSNSGWHQNPAQHCAHQYGSAVPSGSAPSHQNQKPNKRKWMLGIGAALVLVLAVTGGFFGARFFSGSNYDKAPSQKAAVDLADVGRNAELTQLQAGDDADVEQQLVRVVGPRQSVIMALHEKSLQPTWMAPAPHADVTEPDPADIADEDPAVAAGDSADDSSKDSGPKLAGTPIDCKWTADSVVCGDRTIGLKDGEVTLKPVDDSNGSKSDGSSDDTDIEDTSTAEVKDPTTEAVPVTVNDDGKLRSPSGSTYPDVGVDLDATVRMVGAGEDGPWVVSDGKAVVAVDADSVLWESDLSEEVATATGLGEPRLRPNWTIEDEVLVIADDAGVHGVVVDSGQELWRVDAEVDSFTVSGTHLMIMSDGVLEVFDFTDSSDDDTVKADPGYNHGDGGVIAKSPGADAFKNAKLSTPPGCVEFGLAYEDYYLGDGPLEPKPEHEVEFSDGEASADDGHYSGIAMEKFTSTRMGTKAVTAVEFSCNGGGTYIYPSIGIYDEDLNLLDSIELWDDVEDRGNSADISGYAPKPYFNGVSPKGQYLELNVGGIGVYGDDGCIACEKSANADVLYRWDGKSFAHQDTVYHEPSGDVRTPVVAEVQKFAEAVAAGNDTEASKSATPEMMSSLDDILGDGQTSNPPTVRSEQFPKGVKVDTCELIQPYENGDYGGGEYYFANGKTMQYLSARDEIRAGDTVCGVTTPDTGSGDEYYMYLLLRGTPDGSVKVYEAGRQFS
ncbi:hypothetical protein [Brevibacterium aurantiacum]|uniref:Leucine rich repeat variant domain-containing protein n=1 Tax=Brevibacterium aurantiacum TaxID=273384 RepID=A0A1D7W599_BREAU|nr:hypothetical protein [Brevibacterium aurantiacum]AOP54155.1 hypothetical protein BLSMQ_2449 [Brevibacterium aurantiacum]RCS99702.1 hypothetical protein CIK60_03475 [Brevibacterium aurantiacum]